MSIILDFLKDILSGALSLALAFGVYFRFIKKKTNKSRNIESKTTGNNSPNFNVNGDGNTIYYGTEDSNPLKENETDVQSTHNIIQDKLNKLAVLRSEGISDFYANRIAAAEYPQWERGLKNWMEKTEQYLKEEFNLADSLTFRDIGRLPPQSFAHAINDQHNWWLGILAIKIERLLQIISDYRGSVKS